MSSMKELVLCGAGCWSWGFGGRLILRLSVLGVRIGQWPQSSGSVGIIVQNLCSFRSTSMCLCQCVAPTLVWFFAYLVEVWNYVLEFWC